MAQTNNILLPPPLVTAQHVDALVAHLHGLILVDAIEKYLPPTAQYKRLLELEAHLISLLNYGKRAVCKRGISFAIAFERGERLGDWSADVISALRHELLAGVMPLPDDALTKWLKPSTAQALSRANVSKVGELKEFVESNGPKWHLRIHRLGEGKARFLENWLRSLKHLGQFSFKSPSTIATELSTSTFEVAPLERVKINAIELTGELGTNRQQGPNIINARNDLEAIKVFLERHRGNSKTHRSYRKELERFLAWCLIEQHKPLASVGAADCEAYKCFLANIPSRWTGPPCLRTSKNWRPFCGQLSQSSQRYAFNALQIFFGYLCSCGYLKANPFQAVKAPAVENKELLDTLKTVNPKVWTLLVREDGLLDRLVVSSSSASKAAVNNAFRAAVLLIGTTGLRREEAATASRSNLKPSANKELWELRVLGKRLKWRKVYVPTWVVERLREHWRDRNHDFDQETSGMKLISPPLIVNTPNAIKKHYSAGPDGTTLSGNGYSPDGFYELLKGGMKRLSKFAEHELNDEQKTALLDITTHAFRHSFGTYLANSGMAITDLKDLLGHSSPSTTSMYVHPEEKIVLPQLVTAFSKKKMSAKQR